jgi:histidyl-tRNA synthetase
VFDLLPEESAARWAIIARIRDVYERYGYVPLDTPCIERQEVLIGEYGDAATKEIFRWEDPDELPIGLRFDLTVSLARLVATNQDLPRPFRRYQVGPCWRLDKPDMAFGRFREFVQMDIDSVGTTTVVADAELLAAQVEALQALAVPGFRVRVSSRKILAALVHRAGIDPSREPDVLRVIDKLDKVGLPAVLQELGEGRVDASGDPIPGLQLPPGPIGVIEAFLTEACLPTWAATLDTARARLGEAPGAAEGLQELQTMADAFATLGLPETHVRIDLSVARGLAYYTGPVFETHLDDLPRFGAIAAGGRYDTLVERFGGNRVPGTGVSIGIDRLLAALRALDRLPAGGDAAEVLVTVMDRSRRLDYLALARDLRAAGLTTELYVGTQKGLGKQLQYANRRGIPVVLIAGEQEFSDGTVTVKEMGEALSRGAAIQDHDEWRARRFGQRTVPRDTLLPAIREALAIARARPSEPDPA